MKKASLAAVLAVVSGSAMAADTERLAPITVTANRLPQTADEALTSVTVIGREQIEALQAGSLVDILRLQTGVDAVQSGGLGGNASVYLRGTESGHVLVLVNGVRASSATGGAFAWQHLDPAQIERIEIVRGPRASLYGSDAIGGVIQIFTRQSEGPSVYVGGGSFNTRKLVAGYGGGDKVRFNIEGSMVESDGFDATTPDNFSHNPDDDGYQNRSVSAGLSLPLGARTRLEFNGWLSDGELEYDQGRQDTENNTLSAVLRHDLGERWQHQLRLGRSEDRIEDVSAFPATITTERTSLDWQNDLSISDEQLLTLGVSYVEDKGKNIDDGAGSTVFDETTDNLGVFANWLGGFGDNDLQLSARHDDHSEFGSHTTGQIAAGRKFGPANRIWLSYGTAFKAPTLNQLYHPGFFGSFAGNPDLDPERSRTVELGFRHHAPGSRRSIEAALFKTRVDDLIAFVGPNSSAININEADIEGFELSYMDAIGAWGWQANLTLQRARDGDGEPLLRRPDEKLALIGNHRFAGGGLVQAELSWVGERPDRGGDLDAYTLVNLTASVPLTRGLSLEGRVGNLTDENYQLLAGYETAGRNYFVGLRYTPE